MTITQVSEFAPLGEETTRNVATVSLNKRARVTSSERDRSSISSTPLSPVPEKPRSRSTHTASAASTGTGAFSKATGSNGGCSYPPPRSGSPTPSYASSSAFSAATTSATSLSSRASLSSCRSSFTSPRTTSLPSSSGGGGHRNRSSRSSRSSNGTSSYSRSPYSRRAATTGADGGGVDYFPKPLPLPWGGHRSGGANRRRRGFTGGAGVGAERRRDSGRSRSRERIGFAPPGRWSGGKDYASEASGVGISSSRIGVNSSRKRNRSSSRERRSGSRERRSSSSSSCRRRNAESYFPGVECPRCLERCRPSREQRKPITRTLPMDYWVRTPRCKAAKSKHIDFIDDVAYSREQFIEETVFTCPFTGARRDKVLERNMFPYDVPTDVEHWTLWSREDLDDEQMEAFVRGWAAENHPHVVEWECDNNEGERSIDWFHVHVFFRLGCEDRTGVPRDPASVYDGPIGSRKREEEEEEESEEEEGAAVGVGVGGSGSGGDVVSGVETAEEEKGGSGGKGGSPCDSSDMVLS